MKEYIIDAENRALGRVASETALILAGKKEADFAPNKIADVKVRVINLDKIRIGIKKMEQKEYKSYSGYPAGLKITPLKKVLEKKGIDYVFKKSVMGMLPRNKLQKKMIENLILERQMTSNK